MRSNEIEGLLGRVGYVSYSPVGLVRSVPVDDCYYRVCSTYH